MSIQLATLKAIKQVLDENESHKHLALAVKYEIDKRSQAAARIRSTFAPAFDPEWFEQEQED